MYSLRLLMMDGKTSETSRVLLQNQINLKTKFPLASSQQNLFDIYLMLYVQS